MISGGVFVRVRSSAFRDIPWALASDSPHFACMDSLVMVLQVGILPSFLLVGLHTSVIAHNAYLTQFSTHGFTFAEIDFLT